MLSRNGVYYFRWPISPNLHPRKKQSTIKVSLQTRDPKEALRLARFLSYAAPYQNEQGIGPGMKYSEVRSTLHRHFKGLLEKQRSRINEKGPLSPLDKSVWESSYRAADLAAQGTGNLDIISDDTATLEQFIDKYQLPVQVGTQQYEWLRSELHKSYRDYCKDVLVYNSSLDNYEYATCTDASTAKRTGLNDPSVSLTDAVDKFIAQHVRSNVWQKHSEDGKRTQLALLIELLGAGTSIRSIGKPEARGAVDKLQRLPKNMRKSPAFRDKSISELLTMDHGAGMHVRTLNEYIGAFSMLFAWGKDQGITENDPFKGLELPLPKSSRGASRQAFTDEQLRIIENALLAGLDGVPTKLSHKWASLIAMYTGARAGEVCQLTVSDVQERDDILCFSINDDGEEKRVKTAASVRIVPVHSRLIELGLREFVDECGEGRLFPNYSYSPNYGVSKNLSVWFNERLLKTLGIKSKQLVLHSLRHTMNTKLHHASVPAAMVKAITGHTDNSMSTGVYFGAGFKPHQLKEAIEKFSISEYTDQIRP
jgi:integrase